MTDDKKQRKANFLPLLPEEMRVPRPVGSNHAVAGAKTIDLNHLVHVT